MSDWPHAPVHRLSERGAYMVTSGIYLKKHLLNNRDKLSLVQGKLFSLAEEYGWSLQAWAIMSNHYHFVANSPETPESLKVFISRLHTETAIALNKIDGETGRRVWYQFYDSRITYEKSYMARLNYVNRNPTHHNVAINPEEYDWCSALWFKNNADTAFRNTVENFKTDKVNVFDEF